MNLCVFVAANDLERQRLVSRIEIHGSSPFDQSNFDLEFQALLV